MLNRVSYPTPTFVNPGMDVNSAEGLRTYLESYIANGSLNEKKDRNAIAKMILEFGTLTPEEPVVISGLKNLTELPDDFCPQGDFEISYCNNIQRLPQSLNPQGKVSIIGCYHLLCLPDGFKPMGDVSITGVCLAKFPDHFSPKSLKVHTCYSVSFLESKGFSPENLEISHCYFEEFGADFLPTGSVTISDCEFFKGFPTPSSVTRSSISPQSISVINCSNFLNLSKLVIPQYSIYISNCPKFVRFDSVFRLAGHAVVDNCPRFIGFGDGFDAEGDIVLENCPEVSILPASLLSPCSITLTNCEKISGLPDHICPKGNVEISNCPNFRGIPDSLYEMSADSKVSLISTGLRPGDLREINTRQQAWEYKGPSFDFSNLDAGYWSEHLISAENIPDVLDALGCQSGGFWLSVRRFKGNEYWDNFAKFFSRMLKETPLIEKEFPEQISLPLKKLIDTLTAENDQFFARQRSVYSLTPAILRTASLGVGSCIDKVRVCFGLMLLQLEEYQAIENKSDTDVLAAQKKIEQVEKLIEFVSDLNLKRIVYDTQSCQFVKIQSAELKEGDTCYKFSIDVSEKGHEFSHLDATIPFENYPGDAAQLFISEVNKRIGYRFRLFSVSDEVEDILYLARIFIKKPFENLPMMEDPQLSIKKITTEADTGADEEEDFINAVFQYIEKSSFDNLGWLYVKENPNTPQMASTLMALVSRHEFAACQAWI